ncbi:MAG: amino acid ABC transporter substrate-binding protein [Rhodopila sp.]
MTRLSCLVPLTLAAIWTCGAAHAEEGAVLSGTLKVIQERGSILVGFRDDATPFSFLNKANQPIGFSIDLCHGIAEDTARVLHRELLEPDAPAWQTGVRLVYVPVVADERLPKLVSGVIDLECGSTTANAERARTVAFSPIFFLAGTRLMVPLAENGKPIIESYHALAGRTVVVGAGTTSAHVMHQLATAVSPSIIVTELPRLDAAYEMLVAGKADAFASDDILLAGFRATHPEGQRFGIVGDYLSYEPCAIALRREDPAFAELVRDSFRRMAAEGLLKQFYTRWLVSKLPNGDRLNVPMSPHLSEMYRVLGQAD